MQEYKTMLLAEAVKLHNKFELSKTVTQDYFEPGMMEYLDKHEGLYDQANGIVTLRFDSRGTRYDGRTEEIEKLHVGDTVQLKRDAANPFNPNNFVILSPKGRDVGNMPAELCNAIAPLYDAGKLIFISASVSFVEPLSQRSRYAKQAVLFVELKIKLY